MLVFSKWIVPIHLFYSEESRLVMLSAAGCRVQGENHCQTSYKTIITIPAQSGVEDRRKLEGEKKGSRREGEIHFFFLVSTKSQFFDNKSSNLYVLQSPKHLFQSLESKGCSYND